MQEIAILESKGRTMMETVRIRKSIAIAAITATALLPLIFVQLDETRSDLNVYRLLARGVPFRPIHHELCSY